MDNQVAAQIELAVRTRLYKYLVDEFGTLNAATVQLDLPSSKTYRHLDPTLQTSTKKIPLADVSVIAQRLHEYDSSRFPTFGELFDEELLYALQGIRVK